MNGFDCTVKNPGKRALKKPQVPKECSGRPNQCVKGAKQPLYWANERANIAFTGRDKLPSYKPQWGFKNGAQNDIFV